jgi:hypothetical protein
MNEEGKGDGKASPPCMPSVGRFFFEESLLLFSYSSTLEERDWRDNEKWEEESPPPYSSSQMENVASTETNIRKERERMRYTHNDVREREKNDQYYSLSLSLCVCVCM